MADQTQFKHITVNPGTDDDVVIVAGKVDAAHNEVPEVQNAVTDDSSYHQTTLEDIQSSKMPKTQIIVIVLAIVAIVAFAIWYMAFS